MSSQSAGAAPGATIQPDPRRWWALAVIATAQLMIVLDATIVNIALPSAQADLGMSDANRQWVITAYTLAFGSLLLLGGRLGDRFGRKNIFIVGLLGFAAASALGGFAPEQGTLFAARALQGVFGAMLAPAALSLLATTFTDTAERAKAFGVFGAIAGGGSAIGLIAGGVLTEYLDWRWCLFVNVPIAIAAAFAASRLINGNSTRDTTSFDIPGVLLGSAGLFAIVYGCSEAGTRGWSDGLVLTLLIGGAALLAIFTLVESKTANPLFPLHLIMDRNRGGVVLSLGIAVIGMFGLFLFLTFYLQVIKGYSPMETGFAFLPMTAAMIISSTQIAARLMVKVPARALMVPGLLVAASGMALLTQMTPTSSYWALVAPVEVLLGLGLGCTFMPAMSLATSGVAPQDSGAASASVNTAQQVGGSIGTALLNTIAASATADYLLSHPASPTAQVDGIVHGYVVASAWAAALMVLAAVVAFVFVNHRPVPETRTAEPVQQKRVPESMG
ncbi:MFS transporter [Streptomyces fractus]|uniref:MFS transporter n=1 Tax=Streptomyces fractus TaxID=641806 RepID=UPI003CF4716F